MFSERSMTMCEDMETCRLRRIIKELFEMCCPGSNDYTNQLTIKLRVLVLVGKTMGLTWDQVVDLIYTHTPIHEQVARDLRAMCSGSEEQLLAQDFVSNDKLARLLKRLSTRGHANKIERLLAIDGLATKTKRYELKRYIINLRWPLDPPSQQEGGDTIPLAWQHVQAVRRLYDEMEDVVEERRAPYVYEVLRQVIKDVIHVDLPADEGGKTPTPEVMEKCKALYVSCMGTQKIWDLASVLKLTGPETVKKRRRPAVTDEMENE